jgi:hypothetical protein
MITPMGVQAQRLAWFRLKKYCGGGINGDNLGKVQGERIPGCQG